MNRHLDILLPPALVTCAEEVILANRRAGRRVAVAESCTAGLVSAALTEVVGSSDVFEAGIVTYSNEAKMALLGVSGDALAAFGAVSVAVASEMAQGVLARTRADTAVAITGIAGPAGGSERKPVGTIVFARARRGADPVEAVAARRAFGDLGRGGVRLQAALYALELLLPGGSP